MPKNACKCCPIVKRNFRDHYTCHKSRPSVQKYGSFLNWYNENDSPFENTKNMMFVIPYCSNYVTKKFTKKSTSKKFTNNSTHQKSKIYQKTRDV